MKYVHAVLAAGLLSLSACAWAQGWTPPRTIEIVVGYAPGGGVDRTALAQTVRRVLARYFFEVTERKPVILPVVMEV